MCSSAHPAEPVRCSIGHSALRAAAGRAYADVREPRFVYGSIVLARQRAALDSNVFRAGRYVARYVPLAGRFEIDVRCATYGPDCMRAYVVDTAGTVRGTGEPRPARSTDPLAEQCEFASVPCDGQPGIVFKPRALTHDSL